VWDTESPVTPLVSSWGYLGLDPEGESNGEQTSTEGEKVAADGERIVPTSLSPVGSDSSLVAVSFSDAVVKIFDVDTGKEMARMQSDESYG